MKRLLFTLLILLNAVATTFSQSSSNITLTGKILDAKTSEVLEGAVVVLKNTVNGAQCDADGIFKFVISPKDTIETLVVHFIGFASKEIPINTFTKKDKHLWLKIILLDYDAPELRSVAITGYRSEKIKKDATRSRVKTEAAERKKLSAKSAKAKKTVPTTPSVKRVTTAEIVEVRGERISDKVKASPFTVESMDKLAIKSTASVAFYEGMGKIKSEAVPVSYSAVAMDEERIVETRDVLKESKAVMVFAEDLIAIPEVHNFLKDVEKANAKTKTISEDDDDIEPEPSAGQLTAGEWNDLKNWEFWKNSLDTTFKTYVNDWKMNFTQRYSIILRGANEQPISDAIVQLIGTDGITIWTARTDNTGRAELFADVLGATKPTKMSVLHAGKTYNLDKIRKVETGANELKIPVACGFSPIVDIAFVVDATGSMGDEIAYLKAELADVIRQVKRDNQQLSVRLGSVFYRDFGDEYLTRTFPFDKSLKKNIEFIKAQQANGGGDVPEAVPEGLEAAIDSMAWSDNAVTRLLFLVLDAPPHLNAENVAKLQRLTAKAAEKGIRIIPIAASGVDQNTEYLMKAFAVATGGTYTFLTDDSGIGGTHLKATTEKHEVELLNALLVRLIKQYTTYEACNDLATEAMTGGDTKFGLNFRAYPNPVRDVLNLDLKTAVTDVFITNAQGQTVRKLGVFTEGVQTIDVSELLSGVYFVHFKKEGVVCTKKISVVK